MKKKIILILIVGILLLYYLVSFFLYHKNDLKGFYHWNDVDNLMIVAHPDDETIWGGAHLLKGKYLVVCLTCGTNKKRDNEINEVLKISGDYLIVLGNPDKTMGRRNDWKKNKNNIYNELKYIINKKKWNEIVTHNPYGEYGHIHHKMTSSIVTQICKENNLDNLYYFGMYYSKKNISKINNSQKIDYYSLSNKMKMIETYKSQSFIKKSFNQMFEYENFIKYDDWDNVTYAK